jgi:hypothetical protein
MNAKLMATVMALAPMLEAYGQSATASAAAPQTVEASSQQNVPAPGRGQNAGGAYGGGGFSVGGGGGFSGGNAYASGRSGTYSTRLNSIVARSTGSPATVVAFEPMKPKEMEEMQEDLKVFGLILYRGLERALGDRSTEYKLGVPMLLQGEHRVLQANYLEGFGVIAKMTVPFPVAANEGEAKTKRESGAPMTEWEKARRALFGADGELDSRGGAGSEVPEYDEKLVATLKKQMYESIKNGSNLRHVKPDEWISVVIVGAVAPVEGAGSRTQGSILAIRIKKSGLDGSLEDIERTAQTNAYLDSFETPGPVTVNRFQGR